VSTIATSSGTGLPKLESDEVRSMILEQLERLLESHLFRNSKRYPNMLRHIVERKLAGRSEEIKERSLGVAVFGRPPDWTLTAVSASITLALLVAAFVMFKRMDKYFADVI